MANKKASFVIRADGTVIGGHGSSWISGDWLNAPLQPGDMVVVPEKVIGGPPVWKTIFAAALTASSIANSALIISTYIH